MPGSVCLPYTGDPDARPFDLILEISGNISLMKRGDGVNLWQEFYRKHQPDKVGAKVSFHYEKGIDAALKRKYIRFAKWLRKTYIFPVRLHVYILNAETVALKNGQSVYGKICWYPKRTPAIKVPSAIDKALLREYTMDEIYEQILSSLVHELSHYYQWVKGLEQSKATSERQANFYRYRILEEYYEQEKVVAP